MLQVFRLQRGILPGWICAATLVSLLVLAGCVISPRRTLGGGGGGTPTPTPTGTPTPTPTPGATPAGKLYVSNSGANSILRFDQALTASGNVPPAATISGANTTLNAPAYITLDATADRLFVSNRTNASVLIFDNISTKNGNVAPERILAGANTTMAAPTDVALDKTRNLLYVADDIEIHVFSSASTATGNIAPARNLGLTFTVSAIFLDATNDRLFAADSAGNAIAVFDAASTLNGPVTANRTIVGVATHLGAPAGIQIDGAGRLVVSNASAHNVTIYNNAAGATGNLAPSAEIVGAATGLSVPDQIILNTAGTGSLYNADPGVARIAVFTNLSSSTGNIAPGRTIVGPSTTLTVAGQPVGLALDTTR